MNRLAACLLALAVAAPAIGAERTPKEKALIRYATELAVAARVFGACEHYLPPPEAERTLAAITGADRAFNEDAAALRGLFAQNYAKGRLDRDKLAWSADECVAQLQDARDHIEAARRAWVELQ